LTIRNGDDERKLPPYRHVGTELVTSKRKKVSRYDDAHEGWGTSVTFLFTDGKTEGEGKDKNVLSRRRKERGIMIAHKIGGQSSTSLP